MVKNTATSVPGRAFCYSLTAAADSCALSYSIWRTRAFDAKGFLKTILCKKMVRSHFAGFSVHKEYVINGVILPASFLSISGRQWVQEFPSQAIHLDYQFSVKEVA